MQTLLRTCKGAMQTLLCTRSKGKSFRDQKITTNFISAKFVKQFCQTTYISEVYMIYLTTFENKSILRESTFKRIAAQFNKVQCNYVSQCSLDQWLSVLQCSDCSDCPLLTPPESFDHPHGAQCEVEGKSEHKSFG